jgi:hypothetical protein
VNGRPWQEPRLGRRPGDVTVEESC